MSNTPEEGIIYRNKAGHNHDGTNSTKVDFTNYNSEDLAPIIDMINNQNTETPLPTLPTTGANNSIYYHQSGAVALSPTIVAQKFIWYSASSISVYCTLGAVGTTATTIKIYKNNVEVGEVIIPANQGVAMPISASFPVTFNGTSDMVSARVSLPGTNAQELGVEIVAIPSITGVI